MTQSEAIQIINVDEAVAKLLALGWTRKRCRKCLGWTFDPPCPDCANNGWQWERPKKDDEEPNYDAPKPITPTENWQLNDEHHQ